MSTPVSAKVVQCPQLVEQVNRTAGGALPGFPRNQATAWLGKLTCDAKIITLGPVAWQKSMKEAPLGVARWLTAFPGRLQSLYVGPSRTKIITCFSIAVSSCTFSGSS